MKIVKSVLITFSKIVSAVFIVIFSAFIIISIFQAGYLYGYFRAESELSGYYDDFSSDKVSSLQPTVSNTQNKSTPTSSIKNDTNLARNVTWGGPELWEAVNKRRTELGVNPLGLRTDLCTIASVRLNDLLTLGTLDGHEGFSTFQEKRPDLAYIFENYSTIAEFLAVGGLTPQETVSLWENTLGHKQLLTGGQYVWGCIYAQNSFAVAITAF